MNSHTPRLTVIAETPEANDPLAALRREYEHRLRELERRLEGVIEVSSDFYWELDVEHRFTLLQGPVIQHAGVDPRSLMGKRRWELPSAVPVGDNGRWDTHKAVLDAHQPFTDFVYKYLTLEGELHYVTTNGRPVFDQNGRFLGYRGIGKDITRRIQIERRLAVEQSVSTILTNAKSVGEAAQRIIRGVCETLGWACGARWVLDEDTQMLSAAETWGTDAAGIEEFLATTRDIPPHPVTDDGLVRRTCASGQPQWIRNVTKDPSFLRAAPAARAKLRSALAFPLRTDGKVIGAMEFFSNAVGHQADPELLRSATQLGEVIGQFISRLRIEEELKNFRSVMDTAHDLIFLVDPEKMRFLYWNETMVRLTGWKYDDYKHMSPVQAGGVPEEELKRIYAEVIAKNGESVTEEITYRSKDGLPGWFETQRRAVRLNGKWIILTVSREITTRKLAEKKAMWSNRMYAALSATNEAIMHTHSADELYQRVCEAAVNGGKFHTAAILLPDGTRLSVAAAVGAGAQSLRAAHLSIAHDAADAAGLAGTAFHQQAPCVINDFSKAGHLCHLHESATELGAKAAAAVPLMHGRHAIGVLLLYSGEKRAFADNIVQLLERMARNVAFGLDNFEREAERKLAAARIQHLATHDGLTDLPNRLMFSQLLNAAIESAQRYDRRFAVLFIDLDRFKVINDTLGHEAGDKLLQEVARRLRESLRASDVVARLGGDEFVVLVQEIANAEQAAAVARKLLSIVLQPMMLTGQECRVTASIGVAMYPRDGGDEQSLMKNADIAMYYAKEEGKNNFQFHSSTIKSQSLERLTLESALRRALERGELTLHYQPKLDLRSGVITGVEALLRWHNPELGSISPAQFIPLAEEAGVIVPIGRWVLRTACEQNVAWQRQGLAPICMAVNLSARQFNDADLLNDIATALRETGMAPELLELEITEGMVIHNPERALEVLMAIKRMGVRLAIDDFGTGYSSLGQLKNFPIDTLKVDRSFIREIPADVEDKAITQAIIAMGKTLSLTVVAEGVETLEQAEFLRAHACDEMQGFYFSRPVTAAAFAELLQANTPIRAAMMENPQPANGGRAHGGIRGGAED